MIELLYTDKVDGTIDPTFCQRKQAEWQNEQTKILTDIERHQRARPLLRPRHPDPGLAQHAHDLFARSDPATKRRVLETPYSSSTWADGRLEVALRACTLTVRARPREDLEQISDAVLPELGAIRANEGTDYRFRAQAPRAAVADALRQLTERIDYDNFKDAVAARQGAERADGYHDVWTALFRIQTP